MKTVMSAHDYLNGNYRMRYTVGGKCFSPNPKDEADEEAAMILLRIYCRSLIA